MLGDVQSQRLSRRFFTRLLALGAFSTGCRANKQDEALPLLGQIPDAEFWNERNERVHLHQYRGTPCLVAFMFTRCPSVCPRLTQQMKSISEALDAKKLRAQLLSISVDPEFDRPEILAAYAAKMGINTRSWSFLTGDPRVALDVAESGFKIGVQGKADPTKPDLGITHGSHLVLVDQHGRIRKYIRTFDDEAVHEAIAAFEILEREPSSRP